MKGRFMYQLLLQAGGVTDVLGSFGVKVHLDESRRRTVRLWRKGLFEPNAPKSGRTAKYAGDDGAVALNLRGQRYGLLTWRRVPEPDPWDGYRPGTRQDDGVVTAVNS